jgi:ABC-type uncharacterized transport system YnjBCD substrate-binding protein
VWQTDGIASRGHRGDDWEGGRVEQHVLTDPEAFPTDAVISSHLGRTRTLWEAVFDRMQQRNPALAREWRYYKDGKSWLLKVTSKSRTVCWVSVAKGSFLMTFYFADKAEQSIAASDLTAELKEQFVTGRRFGKIRGITIRFRKKADVDCALVLLELKERIK